MYRIIKLLREHCKMKKYEFAYASGMAPTRLSTLEKGDKTNVSIDTIKKFAKVLGIKSYELMKLADLKDEGATDEQIIEEYVKIQKENRRDKAIEEYTMGKTLKAIRVAEEQNIASLALELDTVPSFIERIEECEVKPTFEMIEIYMKLFNISELWLYELFEFETSGATFKEILAMYLEDQD